MIRSLGGWLSFSLSFFLFFLFLTKTDLALLRGVISLRSGALTAAGEGDGGQMGRLTGEGYWRSEIHNITDEISRVGK